jgi:hypothetical protein
VRLITPFSRIALAAFEADNGGKPLGRMGPATVNRWGIAVSVVPGRSSDVAAAIDHVEIQKEGELVRPIRATVGPITTANADGSVRQSTRGLFVFPALAFEPSSDTTVLFIGSSGAVSCTIDRAQLQTLQ